MRTENIYECVENILLDVLYICVLSISLKLLNYTAFRNPIDMWYQAMAS